MDNESSLKKLTPELMQKYQGYAQNTFNKEEIIQCGMGALFHPLAPRFPINEMCMVDAITTMSTTGGNYDKGYVEAELDIDPSLWFFDCHFVGDPVMPGCLGLDALWQLTGFFLSWSGFLGTARALGVKNLVFRGQVQPESKKVVYKIHIKRLFQVPMVSVLSDGEMWIDGVQCYTASDLRLGIIPKPQEK